MASRWWTKNTIALVTGSNKGIGFEIAKQVAQEGMTVILTARDEQKGLAATQKLKDEGLSVDFHQLDVLSTESISRLASWIREQYNGFDILVNNAGIYDRETSVEIAEEVINTNYRAVKSVTQKLLPLLRPSPAGARIVNVSSALGQLERLKNPELRREIGNLENLTEEKLDSIADKYLQDLKDQKVETNGWTYRAYNISKMLLNGYTRVLARPLQDRPDGQHVYVNCATPGYCKTDLTRNAGIYSAEQGADAIVWVALLPPDAQQVSTSLKRRLTGFDNVF